MVRPISIQLLSKSTSISSSSSIEALIRHISASYARSGVSAWQCICFLSCLPPSAGWNHMYMLKRGLCLKRLMVTTRLFRHSPFPFSSCRAMSANDSFPGYIITSTSCIEISHYQHHIPFRYITKNLLQLCIESLRLILFPFLICWCIHSNHRHMTTVRIQPYVQESL